MGEITHAHVVDHLTARGVRLDVATMYADAFTDYQEAVRNIREHGAIVAHPRTSNPMPNPYLDVRDRARATLQKLNVRQGADLWAAV